VDVGGELERHFAARPRAEVDALVVPLAVVAVGLRVEDAREHAPLVDAHGEAHARRGGIDRVGRLDAGAEAQARALRDRRPPAEERARSRRAVSALGAIVPPRGPSSGTSPRQFRRQRSSAARIAAASSGRVASTFCRSAGSRTRSKRRSSGPSTMYPSPPLRRRSLSRAPPYSPTAPSAAGLPYAACRTAVTPCPC